MSPYFGDLVDVTNESKFRREKKNLNIKFNLFFFQVPCSEMAMSVSFDSSCGQLKRDITSLHTSLCHFICLLKE